MTYEELKEEIQRANLVLAGLGEEVTGDLTQFACDLAGLLGGKDYFIVSLSADRRCLEVAGFDPERITVPLDLRTRNLFAFLLKKPVILIRRPG